MTFQALTCLSLLLCVATAMAGANPIEIVAHRGASADAPENTLASVREAWRQGADAAEYDVWLTADNRVVLMHDEKLERTTGAPGLVTSSTWAELRELDAGSWKGIEWAGEPIPLLDHVLRAVPDGKRHLVEIKHGVEIVPHIVPIIRNSGKDPDQIVIISFHFDVCVAIKRELPEHQVYHLSSFRQNEETGEWSPSIDSLIDQAVAGGLDGLDLRWRGPLDAESAQRIKEAGLFLAVWTVNDAETARAMAEIGVESITTDHPGAMREWLAGRTESEIRDRN